MRRCVTCYLFQTLCVFLQITVPQRLNSQRIFLERVKARSQFFLFAAVCPASAWTRQLEALGVDPTAPRSQAVPPPPTLAPRCRLWSPREPGLWSPVARKSRLISLALPSVGAFQAPRPAQ